MSAKILNVYCLDGIAVSIILLAFQMVQTFSDCVANKVEGHYFDTWAKLINWDAQLICIFQ